MPNQIVTKNCPNWVLRDSKLSTKETHLSYSVLLLGKEWGVKVGVLEVEVLEQTYYVTAGVKLTLSFTLKNGQIYFKNLAVFKTQDLYGIFGQFSTLWMKGLGLAPHY